MIEHVVQERLCVHGSTVPGILWGDDKQRVDDAGSIHAGMFLSRPPYGGG